MAEPHKAFIERLFAHRGALQAFFYRRLRAKSDATDLVQEVYLRMLRISDPTGILNPEAYLFTVAGNLLKEHAMADRRQAARAAIGEVDGAVEVPGFDVTLDATRRVERLEQVLKELSPKCCAAVILQYRHGLSYKDIAERLEISPSMVKKYLAQALNHCRRRMARLR